jgi:hypothetical protein
MEKTFLGIESASRALQKCGDGSLQFARGYYWTTATKDSSERAEHQATTKGDEIDEDGGYYVPEPYTSLAGVGPASANLSNVNDYAR